MIIFKRIKSSYLKLNATCKMIQIDIDYRAPFLIPESQFFFMGFMGVEEKGIVA